MRLPITITVTARTTPRVAAKKIGNVSSVAIKPKTTPRGMKITASVANNACAKKGLTLM